ncbi:MAG: large conductance mechanosensitive channel protein MscL [Anaerolineales bacterium]|nr:large conductance mechanosensitive channel protein MscL [Anaerolineales bacterium]
MLKEFKEFIMRGNALDLAVAVVIGGAFGKIVTSLVDDMFMPLIGALMQGVDFSSLAWTVGNASINYGMFIQAVVNFLLVAFIVFLIVKVVNKMKKTPPPADPTTKDCPHCFSAISIKATRCPNCTSDLT